MPLIILIICYILYKFISYILSKLIKNKEKYISINKVVKWIFIILSVFLFAGLSSLNQNKEYYDYNDKQKIYQIKTTFNNIISNWEKVGSWEIEKIYNLIDSTSYNKKWKDLIKSTYYNEIDYYNNVLTISDNLYISDEKDYDNNKRLNTYNENINKFIDYNNNYISNIKSMWIDNTYNWKSKNIFIEQNFNEINNNLNTISQYYLYLIWINDRKIKYNKKEYEEKNKLYLEILEKNLKISNSMENYSN